MGVQLMVLKLTKVRSTVRCFLLVLCLGVVFSACSTGSEIRSGLLPGSGAPLSVLVLPFLNLTTTPDAGKAVTTILTSELLRRQDLRVVPASSMPVPIPEGVSAINIPASLRDRLKSMGVDSLLSGSVMEYAYRSELESEPVVGINWVMTDLRTGQVLWSVALSGVGSCFLGCSQTLTSLSGKLIHNEVDRFVAR